MADPASGTEPHATEPHATDSHITLLSGPDASLLADAVSAAVADAVGAADAQDVVTVLTGDEYSVIDVANAASMAPFLSDFRVVVARGLNRFNTQDLAPLLTYLEAPLRTTRLVLEWGSGAVAPKLRTAVQAAGGDVRTTAPPRGRDRTHWIDEQFRLAQLRLTPAAASAVEEHLGDNLSRVTGLTATLNAVYGNDARLDTHDVVGYLGAAGDLPPWDLTDAIDRGDIAGALGVLERMWAAQRVAHQIMATLMTHYLRALRLDGSGVRDQKVAAQLLGGTAFSAKKSLDLAGRLGHAKLVRMLRLLTVADQDIRGRSGLPDTTVIEVLVGRLAAVAGARR